MDKQKQIEEIAKDVTIAGQVAGDWLMEESRKLLKENGRFKSTEHTKTLSDIVAEELTKMGYRKIPENAVVLTREEHQKYLAFKIIEPQVRGCLDRERELQKQVDKLKEENEELYKENTTLIAGSILQKQDIVRETVEKFAERLKGKYRIQRCLPHRDGKYYIDFNYVLDAINEICKEITEGERDGRV